MFNINNDEWQSFWNMGNEGWLHIIMGHHGEGCNSPLFYLMGKALGLWGMKWIALALTLGTCGLVWMETGWLGVVVFLLIPMGWKYMFEARPYALLMMLGALQYVAMRRGWKVWWINILMALTSSVSLVPIVASGILRGWRESVVAVGLIIYYMSVSDKYNFYLSEGGFIKCLVLCGVLWIFRKDRFFLWCGTGVASVMAWYGLTGLLRGGGQFAVSDRYFIYLLPMLVMSGLIYVSNTDRKGVHETV